MSLKISFGFYILCQRTLAIAAAAVAILTGNEAKAEVSDDAGLVIDDGKIESFRKKVIKPKLVLKLNRNGSDRIVMGHASHRSHSSHRSHRSHSSHSSHSSHYSSSPSYSPAEPTTAPSFSPSNSSSSSSSSGSSFNSTPEKTIVRNNDSPKTAGQLMVSAGKFLKTSATSFRRILYKGCRGEDVKRLQKKLLQLGYDIAVTGYFGDKTEQAVKKFQKTNDLAPTGKVDLKTGSEIGY